MPYILMLEGQEISLTDEVGATDETIRSAIAPFYPEAATAEISRSEVDGLTRIRMVKRAGTKGNCYSLYHLRASEPSLNPALALSWQLKHLEIHNGLSLEELLVLQPQISSAIAIGEQWESEVEKSIKYLKQVSPIPSVIPVIV
ncbi:MAG: hypothetical protein N4J56_004504 [Chroococcidiopsis sp. SAG 2025]|uniref:hypothetical protein n=1 Tax=Chroococcidiopsis sp. SAG 2025 TaxID=171389 RepID=UPI0029372E2F|nr:hypothetical protein [Chroococcidiopsis sp. SAG 2025]MDV2994850.1 hypothetical protein [Chroococcidiopsis sp. SAG 2025]